MDFSKLKGLTIPEGKVSKITDAIGRTLWSAAAKKVKILIKSVCSGINGETASLYITSSELFAPDPSQPNATTTDWTAYVWEEPNCIIELPAGSTIQCTVDDTKQSSRCFVSLNGTDVLVMPGSYFYTVNCNAYITMKDYYAMGEYGEITITEGVDFFTVNGKQFAFRSGQTWSNWFNSELCDSYLETASLFVVVSGTVEWGEEFGWAEGLYYSDNNYVFADDIIQPITYNVSYITL